MNIEFEEMKEQIEGLNLLRKAIDKLTQGESNINLVEYFGVTKKETRFYIKRMFNERVTKLTKDELNTLKNLTDDTFLKIHIEKFIKI